MKKISKRAWMALALAAALLAGLLVFFGEYFIEAKTWVAFPGSPHVYTGVNPDCGKIYDRSGMLLLNTNDGRVYNADEAVRRATLHLLGDRDGYISAPLLQTYASKMIGFDVVNRALYRRARKRCGKAYHQRRRAERGAAGALRLPGNNRRV